MNFIFAVEPSNLKKSIRSTEHIRSCNMHFKEGMVYGIFEENGRGNLTLFSVISPAFCFIFMCIGFIRKFSPIVLINSFVCSVLLSNLIAISRLADDLCVEFADSVNQIEVE